MTLGNSSFAVGIEFEHVLAAISKQIYETPLAFLRENVQNAVDAIRIQALRDGLDPGDNSYRIDVNIEGTRCIIRDNGIGMTAEDLRRLFWTIGASGKRNDEAKRAGCIGVFGIGGFANLGVCSRLEVISQVSGQPSGTATSLSEADIKKASGTIPHVQAASSDAAAPRGTIVVGHLREEPRLQELKDYLTDFVRFARERVFFNGELLSGASTNEARTTINGAPTQWEHGNVRLSGWIYPMARQILGATLTGLVVSGNDIPLRALLQFENGPLDAFKRGFKLCATKIVTQIGVSGRIDCDHLMPTAGRDSLDANSMVLLQQISACMEGAAILEVLKSPELIAQHTRVFGYIVRHGLIEQLDNVVVRMADATETSLARIRQRSLGGSQVFYGTKQQPTLGQIMQARGHVVVLLDADRNKQTAERQYLERFCGAKPMDGVVTCADHYSELNRFEQTVLSEIEFTVSSAYEVRSCRLVAGKLTEDLPVYILDDGPQGALTIYVDVRHPEITKLQTLGITPFFYSMLSAFCNEYLGPTLRKYSPKYFGSGAVNLDLLAKRRSELWILLKDDVQVISRPKQRDVVRSGDVQVVHVGQGVAQPSVAEETPHRVPKILRIVEEDNATGIGGAYIRIPSPATKAYGDLIKESPYRGAVWAGNKILFVASDGISSSFQFEIRLDQLVGGQASGRQGAEGAAELRQPVQELYGEMFFPMADELEPCLIPEGNAEIRIEVMCDWIDIQTSKAWQARMPSS